jgi:hypothetical protein
LLNPNRNPNTTKLEIENELKDFVGVTKVSFGYLVDFTVSNEKYVVTQDVYKIYVSLNLTSRIRILLMANLLMVCR